MSLEQWRTFLAWFVIVTCGGMIGYFTVGLIMIAVVNIFKRIQQ